jgi:CheY-like chemotaxis protein
MTRTILLADDSVTIQKVVELTFLDEDFRVVTVGDGAEAIGRLASERPDLVIADVHMPGADGYQVAEAVGRELPGTPVLLLVGTFEVFDSDRAEATGAAGFLKKPFDSQELLRRVQDLLASGAPAPRATPAAAFEEPAWSGAVPELPEIGALPDFTADEPVFEPVPPAPEVYAPEPPPPPAPVAPPVVARAAAPAAAPVAAAGSNGALSDADVDRIARRVVELIGDRAVRDVAWEVVPDLAEVLLKARIRELEASVE